MNVLVINGSPKGKFSVTLQSIEYLIRHFKDDSFEIFNIGQQIKKFENKDEIMKCISAIKNSDLILFAYPVYTFIAPYQLHRFIELLKENLDDNELKGKFATQITTSLHFYDFTAHRYIEENCYDLNIKVLKGLSAEMEDLLSEKGRKELKNFWQYVRFATKNDIFDIVEVGKTNNITSYQPTVPTTEKLDDYDTLIVTNCKKDDENLSNMITEFQNYYPYKTRIININEFDFSGGCLGCFSCAEDGKCIYKDGFDSFFRGKILTANAVIYAATIKDHSLGASFKIYDDRQFCNGHRTLTMGSPVGYILSGQYSKENNLRNIIEARSEVGHNFFAGVATDESSDYEITKNSIIKLAQKTAYSLKNKFVLPQNFFGIGGMKIFRDLIYVMRGIMKEDHKFYKKHGIYDFPQKQIGKRLKMSFLGLLMSIPTIKKQAKVRMNEAIIEPYKKAIEKN